MMTPRGSGGGGGKGGGGDSTRAPVEAADSLRSIERAKILDLLSEGECEGPATGDAQSIKIDGTPLMNPDGSFNFPGMGVGWVLGTQTQGYLGGFSDAEAETAVNTEVTIASSVTRQITNVNVNAVRITVSVPRLTSQNTTTGDLNGSTVQIAIYVQSNGGGYVLQSLPDGGVISGKTTTRYQRSYRINLDGLSAPWDIRVVRLTADSGSSALANKTYFDSYTEIIDSKLSCPNSALVGLALDASRFSAIPKRSFVWKGIKIQLPSNYNPTTRVYTGVWDGTFSTAWSDNPAWCVYDLLTNTRYGLGNFVDAAQIDVDALYTIGQYCDELVDDGFGGTEPRYTCNLYLQTRAEAYKVVANMASIFRGMVYWGAGAVVPVADMPSDPVYLYNKSNIIGSSFSYQGSAKNTRHTVALVTWNDPDDGYTQKVEYVEDRAGIERYGVNETPFVAFGCTSRGQAHRAGRWLLYTERLETETINFSAGLDGSVAYPGAVITTQDSLRAGKRFGGRILSAVGTAITLDAAVTIESGKTYTLTAVKPDGTLDTKNVATGASTTANLTLSSAFANDPQRMALWILTANDLAPETWRVLAVTETDGKKGTQLGIVALAHNSAKYAAIEQDLVLEPAQTSSLKVRPDGVTGLMATESLFEVSSGVVSDRLTLSWSGTTGRYRVSYRGLLSNWVLLPETPSQTIDIDGLNPDTYSFTVVQLNGIGFTSPPNTLSQRVYGKTAAPADMTGFTVIKSGGLALTQWALPDDLDVRIGGFVVVRHSPLTSGAVWENGIILEEFPGSLVQGLCPLITGTYMVKARDSSGNYSANEVTFVVTEGMVTGFTTVGTTTQHSTFTGTKTNTAVISSALRLDSTLTISEMVTPVSEWPKISALGGISATGSYAFDTYLDLGTSATRRFEADVAALSFDTGDMIGQRTDNVSAWNSVSGAVVNDCDVTLYAAITDDNPAGSPTWSAWHPFMVADFTCRAAKFNLEFVSGQATHNIEISTLRVHAKIPT